jgi:outer membrane protein OmpA-like peptidoglycan-associated protein/tetratricopeptide (TPR) repeat protein
MRYYLIFLLFIGFIFQSFSQQTEYEVRRLANKSSEFELVKENSRILQEGYLFFAEIIVDKLLEINPYSANYNYRKGYIILYSRHDWTSAMPYLQLAVTDIDKFFDAYSSNEKSAPTDALYHLARCYHYDKQLDKARKYYSRFIRESDSKSVLIEEAELRLKQCDVAQKCIEIPRSVKVINVGKKINSSNPDYSPVVSFDGSSLYFTSRREWPDNESNEYKDPILNIFPEDIYVSYRDNETKQWLDPERLSFCDAKLNETTVGIRPDERRIYTYQNGDLYYSDFRKNKFREPALLTYNNLKTKYQEKHCTFTPDGLQIYFVSDRPGGLGGSDIYRMVKFPDGTWSPPMNLGPNINTPYDEEAPFMSIDNKTLYFSSNGPNSMGDFDVFVTIRDEDWNWSNPINLGYPINTPGDDLFYTATADGSKGYLASFRGDGFGDRDIYEIQYDSSRLGNLALLKASLQTSDGSIIPEGIVAVVKCVNCDLDYEKTVTPRIRDGVFVSLLIDCRDYEITFKLDSLSKTIYKTTFSTECKNDYQEIPIRVELDKERKIIVPDINYSLDGIVADKNTNIGIANALITFKDRSSGIITDSVRTDQTGHFVSQVLQKELFGKMLDYEITISKENYIIQIFDWSLTLDTITKYQLYYLIEQKEVGIDLAKTLELNAIYFEFDKAKLTPEAKIELDKIVKTLNNNPTVEIELGSHTDCRSSKSYNLNLSQKRAKAATSYIKSRITNPKRMTAKGYGETQLVNNCECEDDIISNCTEAEHQANRRIEFRIIKH